MKQLFHAFTGRPRHVEGDSFERNMKELYTIML